jgi:4-amino-4-deoxy-L-arabinose transferase-like glycosyltransferase
MADPKHETETKWTQILTESAAHFGRNPMVWLSSVTLLALLPFVDKAFHIDEPLFLWAAHHIRESPLNFYNFDVNWYGSNMPASDVIKNPPAASYYIALISGLIGWSEIRLHLSFLLPAVAAVLGTYVLAQRYCTRPALAALGVLFTPAFLVSSTTIMCDTMMLAFWVWALVFWEKGIRNNSLGFIILSGFAAGICALTKYFGICLLPLMLLDGILRRRKTGLWLAAVVLPAVMVGFYEWLTRNLYGHGLFFDAAGYAIHFTRADLIMYTLVGLAFTGGTILTPVCYSQVIWKKWKMFSAVAAALLLAFILIQSPPHRLTMDVSPDGVWLVAAQLGVFAIMGLIVLSLGLSDLLRARDAKALFLFLWLFGTFVFATFLNWTINARSILPMVPAVMILLMRRIDFRFGVATKQWEPRLLWPILPAAAVALFLSEADRWFANSARSAAYVIHEKTKNDLGRVWFQGHWGFQYYMEKLGAIPLDVKSSTLYVGDSLVIPNNAPNVFSVSTDVALRTVLQTYPPSLIITMDRAAGAGFYASVWGPLPFAIGKTHPERYKLLTISRNIRFAPSKHESSAETRE